MRTHLDVTGSAIEVEVQLFDVSVIGEQLIQIVLVRLLVQAGHSQNPALHS